MFPEINEQMLQTRYRRSSHDSFTVGKQQNNVHNDILFRYALYPF